MLAWLRGRPGKEEGPEAGVRSLCALAHYVTPALTCLRLPASSIYLHASSIMVPFNPYKNCRAAPSSSVVYERGN